MTPLATTLVLTSALLHAIRDLLTKRSVDRQVFMWLFVVIGIPLTVPLFLYLVWRDGLPPAAVLPLVILGSCIHGFYWFTLSKSYDHGELSHVYPISRSAPALTLILAITLLGEEVSSVAVLGILAVVVGAYLINLQAWTPRALLEPLHAIPRERATQFALLTMITISLYSVLDKRVVEDVHPLVYLFLLDVLVVLLWTPYIVVSKGSAIIARVWNANFWSLLWNSVAGFASYGLALMALTMAKVSYVAGLREISIVFAVLFGGHILKEKNRVIRLTSAIIICLGTFLIATAE